MKIVFVGGGSLRVVAETRELLKLEALRDCAEIALYDRDIPRVEAMARVLRQVPERTPSGARISAVSSLDEALDGADFVSVIACPWKWENDLRSRLCCAEHGWIGHDNISPNGAYLALRGGPLVLDVARRMEKRAPNGLLLIFTNPIAILADVVNRATAIRALGVCAGETNHCYDIARIMGESQPCFEFEVEVAGINHLSWLKKLRLKGRDYYPELKRRIAAGVDFDHLRFIPSYHEMSRFYGRMVEFCRFSGDLLYSSEGDGLPHIWFYAEEVQRNLERYRSDPRQALDAMNERTREFVEWSHSRLDDAFWAAPEGPGWRSHHHSRNSVVARIVGGVTSTEPQDVTATYRNRGAVVGFADDAMVEYTMRFCGGRFVAKGAYPYALPPGTVGVTQGLVEFQALTAAAIVGESRRTFAQALCAYPLCRDGNKIEHFMGEMRSINQPELPQWML